MKRSRNRYIVKRRRVRDENGTRYLEGYRVYSRYWVLGIPFDFNPFPTFGGLTWEQALRKATDMERAMRTVMERQR